MKQQTIETLTTYSKQSAIDIGQLMPHLSDRFTGDPIAEAQLRDIIKSPYHDQIVARAETGRIVGTATLSITMAVHSGRNALLEDFVVSPDMRGMGIGKQLWNAIIDWCRSHDVQHLTFTSNPTRTAAHALYLKGGAVIRNDTCYFVKTIDYS